MTDTGSQPKPSKGEAAELPAEAPAPEPWTPRRVSEWNAYYDLYVAGFVILLAFLGSANKIQPINSGLWSLLNAGRQTVEAGAPIVSDTTSIAGQGRRWVNIPWLFEVAHYELYSVVASLAPAPEPGVAPSASAPREQYGAGALIALDSLIRGLTAWLLLGLRRKGPGLWWTALCVTVALGVTIGPSTVETYTPAAAGGEVVKTVRPWFDFQKGGIAAPPSVVAPETWGLLFLAIELLVLHHAINLGKPGRIFVLVPLFLLWANADESYPFGLAMLTAAVVGLFFDKRRRVRRPSPQSGVIALVLSFAATFVNPSHVYGVLAAFGTIFRGIGLDVGPPTPTPVSPIGGAFAEVAGPELSRSFRIYFAALVGLGLASFLLNRRNFAPGRLLMFVFAAMLWALALYFTPMFGVVFVATLALNGQEWYHDVVGTEGRLGAGWTTWSTGGRLVTIASIFAAIAWGVTGWGSQVGESQFGFGFNPDDFPFEAADALRDAPIQGHVLNTSLAQGDALAWRAGSKRKPFIDSRLHLYPRQTLEDFEDLKRDLRDDKVERWQPLLDGYNVGAVMLQVAAAPRTYIKLSTSPNWIPFYDDGDVAMFGRADAKAPAADVAYFKANRLDADDLVFKRPKPVPPWSRPPTSTWEPLDRVFQNRLLGRPQPHTESAWRWLKMTSGPPDKPYLPDPAHCLMAIREARTALALKPDDSTAFRRLVDAYQLLLAQESALILGIPLAPENITRIGQAQPQSRLLANRTRQLLASLVFTIETLPPPRNAAERIDKANLNFALAQLYMQNGAFDLARERLSLLAEDARPGELSDQFIKDLHKQLGDMNQRIEQVQKQMDDLVINRRATPQDKAMYARSAGAPGLAIHELEDIDDAGGTTAGVRPSLVDLYCDAGRPDKALDVIVNLAVDDPSLNTGVGTAAYRQGKVFFLLGNYDNAVALWRDKSIRQVRMQRSLQAPLATQMLLNGEPIPSTRIFMELPEEVGIQAGWEFEMAMAALEGGLPLDLVADHFQTALTLEPNLAVRPVIAYYLEKLGKPVPPPRSTAPRPVEPAPSPAPAEKPELPENVFAPDPAGGPLPE